MLFRSKSRNYEIVRQIGEILKIKKKLWKIYKENELIYLFTFSGIFCRKFQKKLVAYSVIEVVKNVGIEPLVIYRMKFQIFQMLQTSQ